MFAAWSLSIAAAIECPQQLTREDLEEKLGAAESAWEGLDTEGFRDRMNELNGLLLPCIGDRVPPEQAARSHRLTSLQQLELGNEAAARSAWAAAPRVDPSIALPADWLPQDHAIRSVSSEGIGVRRVAPPRSGSLAFDGTPGLARPRGVPTIFQHFDAAGVATSTAYVGPEDPLPAYASVPRTRNRLLAGAGATGALGLLTLGVSFTSYRGLLALADDPTVPAADLDARRGVVNTTYAVGAVVLGAGAGLGVGALAVGPR